ncbi:hypothetical protein [Listeria cornellensis]|uniref:Transposase IS116/IS110/IS902 family protein n=1 Tax=Listeria cornellensis FSL F6-0969 TaxID=1265820 RepID=W7BZ38_9LIST|nr:transposase IS116/IS110/IS902 family protein [Listeria cornellensis FSL F6-0969]
MDILVDSCAGIDIHQKVMVACVLTSPSKGTRPKKFIESFASTTNGLLQMHDWLKSGWICPPFLLRNIWLHGQVSHLVIMKAREKNYNARIRKGNAYLKKVLTQAALALSRGKDNRIKAFFWRIAKYKGPKKAIIATAHLLLRIIYRLLKDNSRYIEFGEHYLKQKGALPKLL